MKTYRRQTPIILLYGFLLLSLIPCGLYAQTRKTVTVNPTEIAKKIANSFAEKYAKNYAATMLQVCTINCNGKYKAVNGYYGIFASFGFNQNEFIPYFKDPNKEFFYAPLSVFRSDYLEAESDSIMTKEYEFESDIETERFIPRRTLDVMPKKLGVEIYSPLNTQYLVYYSLDIDSIFITKNGDRIIKLLFKDKSGSCPKSIRISGSGHILYNETKDMVTQIAISNFVEYYASRVYNKKTFPKQGMNNSILVNYTMINNRLYTSDAALTQKWIGPIDGKHYHNDDPARRFPYENKLIEYEYVKFSDFVLLEPEKREKLRKEMRVGGENFICAMPYNAKIWEQPNIPGINWSKLQKDLSVNGKSLKEQGMKYAYLKTSKYPCSKRCEQSAIYNQKTIEVIYPLLYNKVYKP